MSNNKDDYSKLSDLIQKFYNIKKHELTKFDNKIKKY